MAIYLWAATLVPIVLILLMVGAWAYGYFWPDSVPEIEPSDGFPLLTGVEDVAVLIASHNGRLTVGATIESALLNGCDVYVVSDASSDDTADVSRAHGASVLALDTNVGKPAALWEGYRYFGLGRHYRAVAILDDDVLIEADFVTACLRALSRDTAIVVGKNLTLWPKERRWNIWLAKRAFSYWNYQLVIRRIQSGFGVMNCISGSNSMYRTELLDELLPVPPPYIVDDTYWVLETQRRRLGEIVYAPKARAHLQDPTNFSDWYRQNLRWMWGTFQGIIGHRVGRHRTRFDFAYGVLILHWTLYIAGTPVTAWVVVIAVRENPAAALVLGGGYFVWILAAAATLRHPQLLLLAPAIIVIDALYRVVFVHALVKALRRPTVASCVWTSPSRFATATPTSMKEVM